MIVSNKAAVQRVAKVYQEQRKTGRVRKEEGTIAFNDEVSLSAESREIQAMQGKLQSAPEIRPIAREIKVEIQQGTYKVSARQIAQALLGEKDRG